MCGCGGVHGYRGVGVVAGGHAWLPGACVGCGGHAWLPGGACVVAGGVHGCWGACMVAGGCAWLPGGMHGCWGVWVGYDEIRFTERVVRILLECILVHLLIWNLVDTGVNTQLHQLVEIVDHSTLCTVFIDQSITVHMLIGSILYRHIFTSVKYFHTQ